MNRLGWDVTVVTVSEVIPKLLVHCSCDWRRLPCHCCKHACLRGINDIGHKGRVAQLQVTQRIIHHKSDACSLLERFEHNVEALMEKMI